MTANARTHTRKRESPTPPTAGRHISEQRQIAADQSITLASDLPDPIPVMPEEVDLMHRYFGDLILGALAGDA